MCGRIEWQNWNGTDIRFGNGHNEAEGLQSLLNH